MIISVADPNNIFAAHEGLPVANEISFGTEGRCGDHSASQQGRRLVSPLHARREFGHRDIQRCDARFGEQTRLEASPWRTGSEGRATRSLIEVSVFPRSLSPARSRVGVRWITCSLWHWHSETYWIPKRRISSRLVAYRRSPTWYMRAANVRARIVDTLSGFTSIKLISNRNVETWCTRCTRHVCTFGLAKKC